MLRSQEENIDPVRCVQKTTTFVRTIAKKRHDTDFGFFALELVYGGDFDAFQGGRLLDGSWCRLS